MSIRKLPVVILLSAIFSWILPVHAQDLDPHIRKIQDGIYVYVGTNFEANCGIVLTNDGVVLIDSGHNPTDSRAILKAVRTLTPLPVRYLLHSEPHPDHSTGNFVFSPPAIVIAHEGATQEMKSRDPSRNVKLAASSPEMRAAFEGFRLVFPHIEFQQRMSLNVGERTFDLLYQKNVHSEADVAIWLPRERVLFSAAGVVVRQWNILRPFTGIPDILAAIKMMKALKPEFVIPGHGEPGTVKIFEDTEAHYALVLDRVGRMVREGKSLAEIKKEARFPEYDSWASRDRIPSVIDAAFKAVGGK